MNVLKKIFSSLIISGAVILLIGLYYMMIKAGIPYQDPTTEMQIQYEINLDWFLYDRNRGDHKSCSRSGH